MRVIAFVLLSISAFAACKNDPFINKEFATAVRVPLPGRIPTEISDGQHTFHVQMAKANTMPHFHAITSFGINIILLSDGMDDFLERETFYHELSHIAARLKEPIDGCKKRNEDESIELISPGMVTILGLNPEAATYIFAH